MRRGTGMDFLEKKNKIMECLNQVDENHADWLFQTLMLTQQQTNDDNKNAILGAPCTDNQWRLQSIASKSEL